MKEGNTNLPLRNYFSSQFHVHGGISRLSRHIGGDTFNLLKDNIKRRMAKKVIITRDH